jgi:hypothetical protein
VLYLLLPIGPLEQRYHILIIFSIYFAATPRTRESVATGVVTRSASRCVNEGIYNSEIVIIWYHVN